jgi:CheY-like chemotaxis protein
LEFAVSDSGLGLTTDQRLRLFEPFVQGDRSTSRKFGGSGLGLAISQRLARALGGQITVASAVGQGSQFVLSVPLVAVEEEPTSPPSAVECNSGASYQTAVDLSPPATPSWRFCGRVLLAEDGPDNQRLLNRILTKAGLEVDLVTNGREAVERALAAVGDGRPYDLVLMDMQMPVVDGYKASRRLRAATYTGPIVALTAFAMTGERAKCLASGCNDYLAKPIRRELLLETVGRYLHTSAGEKRPLDPADRLEAYPTGSGILIDTQ